MKKSLKDTKKILSSKLWGNKTGAYKFEANGNLIIKKTGESIPIRLPYTLSEKNDDILLEFSSTSYVVAEISGSVIRLSGEETKEQRVFFPNDAQEEQFDKGSHTLPESD